jgi:hypothetical protein
MKMNANGMNTRHDGEEPNAPARLVAALKEPPPRRVFVPPTVDDAVLVTARRHLAKPLRLGFGVLRSWLLWPAAATACIALIGVGLFLVRQTGRPPEFAREDINRDGHVDILDALVLARAVQAGGQAPSPDLNGDGVVNLRDAEQIAAQAVKLGKGGRS